MRIITYSNRRSDYFKLTLNSMFYSIEAIDVPVTIVLQDPDQSTIDVAMRHIHDPRVTILYVEQNTKFAGTTIAIKWHEPEKFILWQDDLIMPTKLRYMLSNWVQVWSVIEADIVSTKIGTDNLQYGFQFTEVGSPISINGPWSLYDTSKGLPLYLAQTSMMTTKFWRSCWNNGPKAAIDSLLLKNAKKIAIFDCIQYHLSWNQAMDGFNDREQWRTGFQLDINTVEVKDLRTGEIREIDLRYCG